MNSNFSIERKQVQGLEILVINGRIDGVTCELFNRELSGLLLEGARDAHCDFSGVNYLSSAGIRVLLVNYKEFLNVKKSLVLFGLQVPIINILQLAGLLRHLQVFDSFDDLIRSRQGLPETETVLPKAVRGNIEYSVKSLAAGPGTLEVFGDHDKYRAAGFEEGDVLTIPVERHEYALGLGCLGGESYGEYKDRFGEAALIRNHFFYYPAMNNPMVDYLIPGESASKEKLKYFYGAGFNGAFSKILECRAVTGEFPIGEWIGLLLKTSEANLIGLVFMMETSVTEGIRIKKVPIRETRGQARDIFAMETIYDYFDYQLEPERSREIVVGAGFAIRDGAELPGNRAALIPEGINFHLHALSFEKRPFNASVENFDGEIKRFIGNHEPRGVFHMQTGMAFKRGVVGIINLQP